MRRYVTLFIAALCVNAMMILLALPTHAGDADNYPGYGNGAYANGIGPDQYRDAPYLAQAFSHRYDGGSDYESAGHYRHQEHAYGYARKYPRWRPACVLGPLREKKVCDWEPYCWKERECYIIYGRKYCRYYKKCNGGERRCYWRPQHRGRSCRHQDPY